jgi:hypothetical protein
MVPPHLWLARSTAKGFLATEVATYGALLRAFEGKAHHHYPLSGERVELLLIDPGVPYAMGQLAGREFAPSTGRRGRGGLARPGLATTERRPSARRLRRRGSGPGRL